MIDTGDVVLHKPSGETWVVAYVRGDNLCCVGWPESFAQVSDCDLTRAATPEERQTLLESMAGMQGDRTGYDSRKSYARHRLATAEQVLPKEM